MENFFLSHNVNDFLGAKAYLLTWFINNGGRKICLQDAILFFNSILLTDTKKQPSGKSV